MKTQKYIPTEDQECLTFVDWLELRRLKYAHIPQETFTKFITVKMKNRRMGVKAGVPDYMIIAPKGLLFIEMKREKGGKTSPAQKEWIEALNNVQGVQAQVCCGADVAIGFVSRFL
jgi:hypothetical protein